MLCESNARLARQEGGRGMIDLYPEVRQYWAERAYTQMERDRHIWPQHNISHSERWQAWVNENGAGSAQDWLGSIAYWLHFPLWNETERFRDAMDEVDRIREVTR